MLEIKLSDHVSTNHGFVFFAFIIFFLFSKVTTSSSSNLYWELNCPQPTYKSFAYWLYASKQISYVLSDRIGSIGFSGIINYYLWFPDNKQSNHLNHTRFEKRSAVDTFQAVTSSLTDSNKCADEPLKTFSSDVETEKCSKQKNKPIFHVFFFKYLHFYSMSFESACKMYFQTFFSKKMHKNRRIEIYLDGI